MGRSVLVTGASRGIGRATAERLVATGWDVYAGVRDASTAPAGTTPLVLDLTAVDTVALRDALPADLGAVVNNAGVVVGGPVEGLDLDQLRHQLEVNVVGQVAVTQAVLPLLRRSRGRVVLISSVNGRVSTPMMGPYCASKFALEAIADALRVEVRPWGIAVSVVEPGAIDTDLWRQAPEFLEETLSSLDDETRRLYAGHADGMRRTVVAVQKTAAPVGTVVDAIEKALTAKRPRARYVPGAPAKAQALSAALTPTPLWDRTLARFTGIPGSSTVPR
jgi:NAD(P)-dependent dehydrogenase (short-subunit alcohol dehydrogenase family)